MVEVKILNKELIDVDVRLLLTNCEARTRDVVLKKLCKKLKKFDYVREGFEKALLEREEKFPTGLPSTVPIAIPHTDSCYVKKSVIAVATLKKPVFFREMGNPNHLIPVGIIFLLALENPKNQVKVIQQLVLKVQDAKLLKDIKNSKSPQELRKYLLAILT